MGYLPITLKCGLVYGSGCRANIAMHGKERRSGGVKIKDKEDQAKIGGYFC